MILMAATLTAKQVAEKLSVTPHQVGAWKRKGMPSRKGKYDPEKVEAWLIENKIVEDPNAPPPPSVPGYDGQVELTAADCAQALGVNVRTVYAWLKDRSFPGISGDVGQRNGFFPIEKIRAWLKRRDEKKENPFTAANRKVDPVKSQIDEMKLQMLRDKQRQQQGEFMEKSEAISIMANSHAVIRQAFFQVIDLCVASLPPTIDDQIKKDTKERCETVVENAFMTAAELIEEMAQ